LDQNGVASQKKVKGFILRNRGVSGIEQVDAEWFCVNYSQEMIWLKFHLNLLLK